MKKIVAITVFFTLFGGLLHAQQETDLRLGLQISPTFSGMGTDDNSVNRNGTNLGLKLGVRGEIYFRENYAFLVGIGFAFNAGGTLRHENFGAVWQDNGTELPSGVLNPFPAASNLKYNLQYVEIPFGLKFRTNEIGYLRYFGEVPISIGFNSQASGNIAYTGFSKKVPDIKGEVTDLSLAWGITGGVEYSISGSTALIAGLGYQRVFTDITKDYKPDITSKAFISTILLHLGVMF